MGRSGILKEKKRGSNRENRSVTERGTCIAEYNDTLCLNTIEYDAIGLGKACNDRMKHHRIAVASSFDIDGVEQKMNRRTVKSRLIPVIDSPIHKLMHTHLNLSKLKGMGVRKLFSSREHSNKREVN